MEKNKRETEETPQPDPQPKAPPVETQDGGDGISPNPGEGISPNPDEQPKP